jgi:hypothetical protein
MPIKITNLPDQDRVMRHVPWKKLRRDGDDNVLGFLPTAFELRPDEDSLSVNWIEYFPDPATRVRDCIWAMRRARKAGGQSAFAIGNVGKIKDTCLKQGYRVRIVHEPNDNEPAHSAIRRLPRDDLTLLAALADDAFVEMVRNTDISVQPGD